MRKSRSRLKIKKKYKLFDSNVDESTIIRYINNHIELIPRSK